MDGHFSRDQIYGLIIFFGSTKSGRSNSALDLFIEGGDQLLQKKKKEKVIPSLAARFVSFLG